MQLMSIALCTSARIIERQIGVDEHVQRRLAALPPTHAKRVEATVRRAVVGLPTAADQRRDGREEDARIERRRGARKLQAPGAVYLWSVHAAERARRLGAQQPVG